MATTSPTKKPATDCEITAFLKKNGFVKTDSYTMKLGDIVVSRPRPEQTWWTVYKRNGTHTWYFVDFPKEAPARAICAFIEAI